MSLAILDQLKVSSNIQQAWSALMKARELLDTHGEVKFASSADEIIEKIENLRDAISCIEYTDNEIKVAITCKACGSPIEIKNLHVGDVGFVIEILVFPCEQCIKNAREAGEEEAYALVKLGI